MGVGHVSDVDASAHAQAALGTLRANKDRWLKEVSTKDKMAYLDGIVARLGELDLGAWAQENARVWGFDPEDPSQQLGQNALGMESLVPAVVIKGVVQKIKTLYQVPHTRPHVCAGVSHSQLPVVCVY